MPAAGRPLIVTGASGLIGARLCAEWERRGGSVLRVSRTRREAGWIGWQDLPAAVAESAAVVNLAGEPVAGRRWSARVKEEIRASRVRAAEAIAAARPSAWIQASAVGWYGDRGEETLTEASVPGEGFLAEVCQAWEEPCLRHERAGGRGTRLRFGIVLAREGGALAKMLPAFRCGVGGRLGDGRAWMSWIHAADAVGLILAALDDERWRGAVNVTAPEPVRNADFTRTLARRLHRPALLAVPRFGLRALFGEGGDLLLASQRARPEVALRLGYEFRWPRLDAALADLLG